MNKLGKGLSALIPDKNLDLKDTDIETKKTRISLDLLCPGKFQPRKDFDEKKLQELVNSIKSNGVIQPIIVRRKTDSNQYEIIAGERRTRASKVAGLEDIPAIILDISDKKALEFSIIENVQRDDLNVIEEAEGYKILIDNFGYLQEELSKFVGKSRSHVANCLRLLTLDDEVKELLQRGLITSGHARPLIGVASPGVIAKHIVKKSLSVRQTEDLVRKIGGKQKKAKNEKSPDMVLLEDKLSAKLGLEVQINDNKKEGSVVIKFKSLEELSFILKKLSGGFDNQIDSVNKMELRTFK